MVKSVSLATAQKAIEQAREILVGRFGVDERLVPGSNTGKGKLSVASADDEGRLWLVSFEEDTRLLVEFFVDERSQFLWVKKISLRHQEGFIVLQMEFEEELLRRFSIFNIQELDCLGPMGSLLLEIIRQDRRLIRRDQLWIDLKFVSGNPVFRVGKGKGGFLKRITA